MALVDGVSFLASSSGTGTFVFSTARSSFLTLAQAQSAGTLTDGQTVSYLAQDSLTAPTQREWGHGTYSQSGNSIARTTVLGGSNGTSPVSFSVAPIVSLTALAEDFGSSVTGANPTATAGDTAVNGSATTFMRSDAAPAVQKGSATAFGIVKVDNITTTASSGVISAVQQTLPAAANPTATAGSTAVNGTATTFMRSDAAPAVTTATTGQLGLVKPDGTTITISGGTISSTGGGRTILTTNTTYYVSTTGSDSNDGSSGAPWATLQHAYNTIINTIDFGGFTVTVQLVDGSYTTNGVLDTTIGPWIGGGKLAIQGNLTDQTKVSIDGLSGHTFTQGCNLTGQLTYTNIQLANSTATGAVPMVFNIGVGFVDFINCNCGAISSGSAHFYSGNPGAVLEIDGSYTITGGGAAHIFAYYTGSLIYYYPTSGVTASGTINFSQGFALAQEAGVIDTAGVSFSGTFTGPRFEVTGNGVIETYSGAVEADPNYFPGDQPGQANIDGGIYAALSNNVTNAPSTGDTVTATWLNPFLILKPSGTLATLTVNLPAYPSFTFGYSYNGQVVTVLTKQAITALTIAATDGSTVNNAPTTLGAGQSVSFIYREADTAWYCMPGVGSGGGGSTSPGGSSGEIQYNNSGAFGGTSGVTFPGTGRLSVSADVEGVNASGTNTAATGIAINNSLSTGNATNPDLLLQVGVKTSSGSSQATETTALTVKGDTLEIDTAGPIYVADDIMIVGAFPFTDPLVVNGVTPNCFIYHETSFNVLRIGAQGGGIAFINFELPTGGGTYQDVISMSTSTFVPSAALDASIDVGVSGNRWRNGLFSGSIDAQSGFAVNGNAGLSVTITTAKLTSGGSTGSMTFTGGILTAQTQAT